MKKYMRVDIVDNDCVYDSRVMDTYILINPNKEKLEELQNLLNERFENDDMDIDYGIIHDFISDNFEILDIDDYAEIVW